MPYVGVGAQQHESKRNLLGKPMIRVYGVIIFALLLTVAVAFLGKHHHDNPVRFRRPLTVVDIHNSISEALINNIDPERIKQNLRLFTKEPHLAGSEANKRVATTIAQLYTDAGLEDVHMVPYEVLLSYPDFDKPNQIVIRDSTGKEIFRSKGISPVIIPEEQSGKYAGNQWLAYAEDGSLAADVIYANRGSDRDFENLKKMGVDPKGKIALMRYGEGFRGDKVAAAQRHGAVAAILFSDPDDVAREGLDEANVYPKKNWMPKEGVQRGSIMHGIGDPLSPLYPSKDDLFKSRTIDDAKEAGVIPRIPAMPISYTTAYEILSRMQGRKVPLDWQGAVNVTYKTGPGMEGGQRLTVEVHSSLKSKKIRNVMGYIRGSDEMDRYVMLGNHFDAWVYGSNDPNSGTAILAEVARAMVQTMNETGWRPARSIVFLAWDAEEYGIIGSTEFVEEYESILRQRAVVYINMDTALHGNMSLDVQTVPSLQKTVMEIAKRIPNPLKREVARGRATLYDTWAKTFPSKDVTGQPNVSFPGGGSDHAPFLTYGGIPVVNFCFKNKTTRDTYPLYHTLYETPFLNEHLLDIDGFSIHRAVGQYWAELARYFTDEAILPFNSTQLAVAFLKDYLPQLKEALLPFGYYKSAIDPAKQQLANIVKTAQDFFHMSRKFERTVLFIRHSFELNPYDQRHINAINERIMNVERCFVNPRGMPSAPQSRHVLYSLSDKNSYAGRVMAAVYDSIDDFAAATTETERTKRGREIAQQISIVQYSIQCAISTQKELI